ncbi:hypothetical protein RM96_29135 [Cupriavidus sp. IDO]|nr:hypothetical protein RM96_29135 [Cupriavidus sp. IDO]
MKGNVVCGVAYRILGFDLAVAAATRGASTTDVRPASEFSVFTQTLIQVKSTCESCRAVLCGVRGSN